MFIFWFNLLLLVHVCCVGLCLSHVIIFIFWLHRAWCIASTWDFFIIDCIFKLAVSFSCISINCLLQTTHHWCPYKKQSIYQDTWVPTAVLASSIEMIFTYVVHQYINFTHNLVPHTLIFFHLAFPSELKTPASSTFNNLRLWVHLSPLYLSQWSIPQLDPHPLCA